MNCGVAWARSGATRRRLRATSVRWQSSLAMPMPGTTGAARFARSGGARRRCDHASAPCAQSRLLRGTQQSRQGCLSDLGRLEEALASYERALALKPDFVEAWNNQGTALGALERHEEALASYGRALVLEPDHVEAHVNRGNALRGLQRHPEALASYEHALALRPDCAEAHYNRGVALDDLGRHAEALASYERALAQIRLRRSLEQSRRGAGGARRDAECGELRACAAPGPAIRRFTTIAALRWASWGATRRRWRTTTCIDGQGRRRRAWLNRGAARRVGDAEARRATARLGKSGPTRCAGPASVAMHWRTHTPSAEAEEGDARRYRLQTRRRLPVWTGNG